MSASRPGHRYPQHQLERTTIPRVVALCCAALLVSTRADAGNIDSFYMSGDGALQAGAITADARGGGALWYNPAGLAQLPGLRLDVSASAYSLRLGGHPDFDAGGQGTRVTRLTTIDLNVVPTGLALTRRLGSVGVGLGAFVPTQRTTFLRTRVDRPASASGLGVDFGLDFYERTQEYFAGPGLGFSLHPAIDFGAALMAHYKNQFSSGVVYADVSDNEGGAFGIESYETLDLQQLGLQAALGLQLRPTHRWSVGFAWRLPALRLVELRQAVSLESSYGEIASDTTREFTDESGISTSITAPARFHAGSSFRLGRARLALEANYQAPLRDESAELDLAPEVNLRVGGRYDVSETLAVGGGLFSDRSPNRTPVDFGDNQLDFYGLTLALDVASPYSVVQANDPSASPPQQLSFGTTVALTYAIGVGELVRGEVDPDSAFFFRQRTQGVTAHEITLHVGSSLSQ